MDSLEVKVARLDVQVASIQTDVTDIKADQKAQNTKLDTLVAAENQRKGARTLMRVLGGLISSGGFAGWLWEHFHK